MALTQPVLNQIVAFDSTDSNIISFSLIGGDQVVGNRLLIKNNQTGATIYNQIQYTYKFEHTIPAGTLTNGGYYNATLTTLNFSGVESTPSIPVAFRCFTTPLLTITNVNPDDIIEQSTYKFTGNYSQIEGELINGYKFILYDTNENILSQSDILYTESIEYSFLGFSNNTQYYIELIGTTIEGTSMTSGLIVFTVRYISPFLFSIAGLENQCETGNIQISSNIVAIDGTSNPTPPIYGDSSVDLTSLSSWVQWLQGYNIKDDLTMRAWGSHFNKNETIITLSNNLNNENNLNKMELKYIEQQLESDPEPIYGVQLLLRCWTNNSSPYVIHSNIIESPLKIDTVFIWLRRSNNLFDLKIENITNIAVTGDNIFEMEFDAPFTE